MEMLQIRFRDKASEILQENPTIVVAMGHGETFNVETFYCVGTGDELSCVVKPNPAIVEAVRDDAHVAFAVNKGFPNRMLQGTGRAFFLGRLEQYPQIREQILEKTPDAAPFLTTIRNLGVLKILPDQIYITDDTNLGLGPRPVYLSEAVRASPGWRQRWLQALGVSSWTASLVPMLVGTLLSLYAPADVNWWLFIPFALAALLFQSGTILVKASDDLVRGSTGGGTWGSSRVLVDGLLPLRQVFWVGMLCFVIGSMIGLALVAMRGMPLLLSGLVGVLGGLIYAGWPVRVKYRAMGDVVVFLCMGPLLVSSAYVVLTGTYRPSVLLVSLPIGLLAEAIMHASNLHATADHAKARIRILAMPQGWEGSPLAYSVLIGLAYLIVMLLILAGSLPSWGLLVLLSVPLAVRPLVVVWRSTPEEAQGLIGLDGQTAHLHLAFGLLLALGLVLGYA